MLRLALLFSLIGGPAFAQASCYNVNNPDERYLCLALARHDRGQCASISNTDRRNFCVAQVEGSANNCASINDAQKRQFCRGLLGR